MVGDNCRKVILLFAPSQILMLFINKVGQESFLEVYVLVFTQARRGLGRYDFEVLFLLAGC
jgi:hypothetical protein